MDRADADELLRTLFTDVDASRTAAETVLITDPDPYVASIGHQVLGIVLRDQGSTEAALAELRTSVRLARRSGDPGRWPDAMATLGLTKAISGRMSEGLRELGRAAAALDGVPLGRVLVRRAMVTGHLLARYEESADDLRRARELFAGAGDLVWETRALNLQGLADARLGRLESAEEAFERYGVLSLAEGNGWQVATSVHNRGWLSFLRGDLPRAFELYAEASEGFDTLGITSVDLVHDRATAYLAGGLAGDALAVVEQALVARPLVPRERPDLLVSIAQAALAAGDWQRAISAADEGSALLRAQSRELHRWEADLLAMTARAEAGHPPAPLLRRVEGLVERLREAARPELPHALLLGARLAGRVRSERAAALADGWLDEASGYRRAGTGSARALGWLALAQRRRSSGDSGGVLRACDLGLRAVDEHRSTLGSQELRAVMSRPRHPAGRARHPYGPGLGRRPAAPAVVGALARDGVGRAAHRCRAGPDHCRRPRRPARTAPAARRGPEQRRAHRAAPGPRRAARADGAPATPAHPRDRRRRLVARHR